MNLLKRPLTDFAAVRDGRQSLPLYIDVDLTTARSISGNNPLILNIAGNSFYTDADTTNGGNAIVHFQDTNLGNASAPFFVSPGFIANVGFTQLLIENTAQAGKRMRIFYGVDIDFQAGVNASIAISGAVSLSGLNNAVFLTGSGYGASYQSVTALAANTPETVFAPAANLNGAIIHSAAIKTISTAGNLMGAFIAKTSAPTTITDGDIILMSEAFITISTNLLSYGRLNTPIKIPSGKGLYYISNAAESATYPLRNCLYTLL